MALSFSRLDRVVQSASGWATVFAVLSGAYYWLSGHLTVLGKLNWADKLFLGIGAALITLLILAACIAAFRYFRPLTPLAGLPFLDHHEPPVDLSPLESRVTAVEKMNKAIVDDYQRMLALDCRFEEYKTDINSQLARLWAHRSLDADDLLRRFRCVYEAFGAIYHRERLLNLGRLIEAGAIPLGAATHENVTFDEDKWEAWSAQHRDWNILVHHWCDLAENYVEGISAKVLTTSDQHYQQKGVAKVEQFPDAEAYIAYKVFWAILKNWRDWQMEALRAVHQVAFNGGGRTPVAGGGDLEELGERDK